MRTNVRAHNDQREQSIYNKLSAVKWCEGCHTFIKNGDQSRNRRCAEEGVSVGVSHLRLGIGEPQFKAKSRQLGQQNRDERSKHQSTLLAWNCATE